MSKKILLIFITILSTLTSSAYIIDSAKVLSYTNPAIIRVYYYSSGSGQINKRIASDVSNGGTFARVNLYFAFCLGSAMSTHDSVDYTLSPSPSQNLFDIEVNAFIDTCSSDSIMHQGNLYTKCQQLINAPIKVDSLFIQAPAPAATQNYNLLDNEIYTYPNPAHTTLHLGLRTDIKIKEIQLYNLLGTKQRLEVTTENKLDISHLPNGIYILYLHTNKGVLPKRIIVNK